MAPRAAAMSGANGVGRVPGTGSGCRSHMLLQCRQRCTGMAPVAHAFVHTPPH